MIDVVKPAECSFNLLLSSYPLSCVRLQPVQRCPRVDLQGALGCFLSDVRDRLQSVCGFPARLTSKPCYHTVGLNTAATVQVHTHTHTQHKMLCCSETNRGNSLTGCWISQPAVLKCAWSSSSISWWRLSCCSGDWHSFPSAWCETVVGFIRSAMFYQVFFRRVGSENSEVLAGRTFTMSELYNNV